MDLINLFGDRKHKKSRYWKEELWKENEGRHQLGKKRLVHDVRDINANWWRGKSY